MSTASMVTAFFQRAFLTGSLRASLARQTPQQDCEDFSQRPRILGNVYFVKDGDAVVTFLEVTSMDEEKQTGEAPKSAMSKPL